MYVCMYVCKTLSCPQEETGIPGSDYGLVKSFGSCEDDVCYEKEQEDFIAGVNTLDANLSGFDGSWQESQTIALVRAAEDWAWREGVLKVRACLSRTCGFLLVQFMCMYACMYICRPFLGGGQKKATFSDKRS